MRALSLLAVAALLALLVRSRAPGAIEEGELKCQVENPVLPSVTPDAGRKEGNFLPPFQEEWAKDIHGPIDVVVSILFVYVGVQDQALDASCSRALERANRVFATSLAPKVTEGVQSVRFRIADCVALGEVAGLSGTADLSLLLARIACECEEYGIHRKRDDAKADIVCFVHREDSGANGYALIFQPLVDPSCNGFCVVTRGAIESEEGFTLTHELGHMFGCLHAPAEEGCRSPSGAHPYAFDLPGGGPKGDRVGTVMALTYTIPCFSSPRLAYDGVRPKKLADMVIKPADLSTLDKLKLGRPGGCDGADNVSVIRTHALAVALYRGDYH